MKLPDFVRLLRFLLRTSEGVVRPRLVVFGVAFTGIVAGLVSTGLLAVINELLTGEGILTDSIVVVFIALIVLLPLSRFMSNFLLVRLAQGINLDLRVRLSRRILQAPMRELERLGPGRLLATLTDDIQVLTAALTQLPTLFLQLTVVVGCLTYMGWLSWPLLLVVLGFVVIGVLSYRLPAQLAQSRYRRGRDRWDDVVHHFRGLTEGTKELKLHRSRRRAFLERQLEPSASELRDHAVAGGTIYAIANSWGQTLFFILIGLILFVGLDRIGAGSQVAVGFTLAILYMLTPLDVLLNMLPAMGRAVVAAEQVEKLGLSLEQAEDDGGEAPLGDGSDGWRRLSMRGVTQTYYREDADDTFTLGPIDLDLVPGELVFVTGGNGSGKTTLAKVLIGLYVPEEGELRLDDEVVTPANRDSYRQMFSVVFSDFFLFETLLGLEGPGVDEEARRYLADLHLQHKVRVEEGRLSTLDLSQGQRKRLALLTAYLEDRPIFLFDEWAADQDPYFKEIFYRELLPRLKEQGKAVVVISHDDRYYPLADRLVKLEYGRKVFDGRPTDPEAAPAAALLSER